MAYGQIKSSSGRVQTLMPDGWQYGDSSGYSGPMANAGDGLRLPSVGEPNKLAQLASGYTPDMSRPMVQIAGGSKGYYSKEDPSVVVGQGGNVISRLNQPEQNPRDLAMEEKRLDIAIRRKQLEEAGKPKESVPAGYRMRRDGGDGMEAIPGGPADLKAQGKFNQDLASMQSTESAMNSLAQQANELLQHKGLDSAVGWQSMFPSVPGGKAKDFEALLDTLRSKTAFGTLQAMRDASKTGGALGAVSEKELKLLESNLSALEKAQSPQQFRAELAKLVKYADEAKSRTRQAFNMSHGENKQLPIETAEFDADKEARYQAWKKSRGL